MNDLTLDNRTWLAPMTRVSAAADGRATAEMVSYYRKFADGGFSFLISEGIYTDTAYSQGYENQPGLVTEEHVESWRDVTSAVHDAGAPMGAQLMHAGAQAQQNPNIEGEETIAPSPVKPSDEKSELYGGSGEYPTPPGGHGRRTRRRPRGVRRRGRERPRRWVRRRRDPRRQRLLAQRVPRGRSQRARGRVRRKRRSAGSVPRGGDRGRRRRHPQRVRCGRARLTDDGDRLRVRWPEGEDAAAAYFGAFSDAGADYVHVTEPDITDPAFGDDGPTLAEAAVEYADATVIANGGLGDPEAAAQVVEAGADLVTLATCALANHDWPQRVREGKPLDNFDFERILTPVTSINEEEIPRTAD